MNLTMAEIVCTSPPEDWMCASPDTYHHGPTSRVLQIQAHRDVWRLYEHGVSLGTVSRISEDRMQDVQAAVGAEAQAILRHWTLWIRVQLIQQQAPGGDYDWHLAAGLLQGTTEHFIIEMPKEARAALGQVSLRIGHQLVPLLYQSLNVLVPQSMHARMELLEAGRAAGI